jgi:hypothetical protein
MYAKIIKIIIKIEKISDINHKVQYTGANNNLNGGVDYEERTCLCRQPQK